MFREAPLGKKAFKKKKTVRNEEKHVVTGEQFQEKPEQRPRSEYLNLAYVRNSKKKWKE